MEGLDLRTLLSVAAAGVTSLVSVALAFGGEREKRIAMQREIDTVDRKGERCSADTKAAVDNLRARIDAADRTSWELRAELQSMRATLEATQHGVERIEKRLDRRRQQTAEGWTEET